MRQICYLLLVYIFIVACEGGPAVEKIVPRQKPPVPPIRVRTITNLVTDSLTPETHQSLMLYLLKDGEEIGMATGFIIKSPTQYYLITNWHVVTGRDPNTHKALPNSKVTPNSVGIRYPNQQKDGYIYVKEKLQTADGSKTYKEWGTGEFPMDIVAIPLRDTSRENIYISPIHYWLNPRNLILGETDIVSIVGYPIQNYHDSALAAWTSGPMDFSDYPPEGWDSMAPLTLGFPSAPGFSGSPIFYINDTLLTKDGRLLTEGWYSVFMGILQGTDSLEMKAAGLNSVYLEPLLSNLP